jgi:hypothetical protein
MKTSFKTLRILALTLLMSVFPTAHAGLDDCLKTAFSAANPDDLAKAAKFAGNHTQCLPKLIPPELVPYVALSGSMDVANQSGLLNKVGLGFNSYSSCSAKFDPAKTSLKAMAPVLKPICGKFGIPCQLFEQSASNEINAQLTDSIPVLGLLPCACAAATSGLGVEKIADLVDKAKGCGNTVAQVAGTLSDGAKGAYNAGKSAVNTLGDAASTAGCAVISLFGGCSKSSPPPPTGYSEASKWCAPQGGLKAYQSKSNQPNDYSVQCNDGAACILKPNQKPMCATAAEQKAHHDKQATDTKLKLVENELWCTHRKDQLHNQYSGQCHDKQCQTAINFGVTGFFGGCIKGSNGNSESTGFPPFSAEFWAKSNEKTYTQTLTGMVNESIMRDANASAMDKYKAGSCVYFLGRPNQLLCETKMGFEYCKTQVDKGAMGDCRLSGSKEIYTGKVELKMNPQTTPQILLKK